MLRKTFSLVIVATIFVSCGEITQLEATKERVESNSSYNYTGVGLIYPVNPNVATGKSYLEKVSYGKRLQKIFITEEPYLQRKNYFERATNLATTNNLGLVNLFLVVNDAEVNTVPIQATKGSWLFDEYSDEFYQVNTYFHVNKLMSRYLKTMAFGHAYAYLDSNKNIPPAVKYNYEETGSIWLTDGINPEVLNVYSKCYLDPINAYYAPIESELCFGYNSDDEDYLFSQDPSIIYHELGHAMVDSMINQRNIKSNAGLPDAHDFDSSLGFGVTDEGGSINEGLADFFAYIITGRNEVGEWAGGNFYGQTRPMSEDSSYHQVSGISTEPGERLSYPNYLHYNAATPNVVEEDIHNAGQIVTHYLVALNKILFEKCGVSSSPIMSSQTYKYFQELVALVKADQALIHGSTSSLASTTSATKWALSTGIITMSINETLAELGDLFGEGSDMIDDGQYFTNLNPTESFLWHEQGNPITFRRFFKVFAKNLKHYASYGLCPEFTLDNSEQLLDEYGLLLFTYYGDIGQSGDGLLTYDTAASTAVLGSSLDPLNNLASDKKINDLNRRNSVLVSKEFIDFPNTGSIAFISDSPTSIQQTLANTTFQGKAITTSDEIAGVKYNNSNGRISPGEIVGLTVMLKNYSNSPVAGVQVLANDWDHMKLVDNSNLFIDRDANYLYKPDEIASFGPCMIDGWPQDTEGGLAADSSATPGNCNYYSRDNAIFDSPELGLYPKYELDSPQPICLVQYSDQNETKWVSQNYYRKVVMGLEDKNCLNNESLSGANFNPNECLMRFLPGANHALISKIDPGQTWAETLFAGVSDGDLPLQSYHGVLMEVNKWITPGTKFTCRFRVRFTNCSDCFAPDTDSEDYPDYMYTGAEPFKVLDLQFTVID